MKFRDFKGANGFVCIFSVLNVKSIFFSCSPENVKRLYDLVKVQDPTVKIAYYFALKDTLVAENLDQATRIAYPKVSFIVFA